MDRAYIQSHGIAHRYLSGRLSEPEAHSFEKACLADPSLLEDLNLDFQMKRGFQALAANGEIDAVAPMRAVAAPRASRFAMAAAIAVLAGFGAALVLAVQSFQQRRAIAGLEAALAARSAPSLLAGTVRVLTTRGERIDVSLPATGALGVSIDAPDLEERDVVVQLQRADGAVVLRREHRVAADGTVFLVVDRDQLPAGDYTLALTPQAGQPPAALVYPLRVRHSP